VLLGFRLPLSALSLASARRGGARAPCARLTKSCPQRSSSSHRGRDRNPCRGTASRSHRSEQPPDPGSFMEMYQEMTQGPAIFQMGTQRRHFRLHCSHESAPMPFVSKRARHPFPGPSR